MKGRPAALAAAVVGAALALLVLLLATSDTQRTDSVNFQIVGAIAPQIAGTTLTGEPYDLFEQRGEWVVVNFFASWCVGCRVEHPELVQFTEAHRDDPVQLVSVMYNDTEESGRAFFDELGGAWPTLVNDLGPVHLDYGVTGVPETLLVSPSGRVVAKWASASGVTAAELDAAIAELTADG